MEFHGIFHGIFHGVSWNSMEFHGIPWKIPWIDGTIYARAATAETRTCDRLANAPLPARLWHEIYFLHIFKSKFFFFSSKIVHPRQCKCTWNRKQQHNEHANVMMMFRKKINSTCTKRKKEIHFLKQHNFLALSSPSEHLVNTFGAQVLYRVSPVEKKSCRWVTLVVQT
jgi:hypothetical protein